jgi:predicted deacetylase
MQNLPSPAQYLLRIDDICPTMDRKRWSTIRDIVREHRLRPILAVIPDNQDYKLQKFPPYSGFWEEMREFQAEGATIAVHGYHHLCTERAGSLIPLHHRSEFTGLSLKEQRYRVRAGLTLLRNQGLSPRLFVAPNHSFDRTTLSALREEGLSYLSDGFARVPFTRDGVTWIPQQLWAPMKHQKGLWTICLHSDSTGPRRVAELSRFLKRHGKQFTSFDEVIQTFRSNRLNLFEQAHEKLALWRAVLHRRRMRAQS